MAPTRASRRPPPRQSDLGDSWVVNDSDANSSESEQDNWLPSETVASRPTRTSQNYAPSDPARPRQSARASSALPEPDLIMPSIHDGQVKGSWARAESKESAPPSARRRTSNTAFSSRAAQKPSRIAKQANQVEAFKAPHGHANEEENMADRALSLLAVSLRFFLDVIGGALKALRKPISWLVASYLFAGILLLMWNLVTRSVYSALSPVCRIPGVSMLDLPICGTLVSHSNPASPNAAVEFDQLMNVQGQFEDVMAASAESVSLPLDMKRGETSIRDLRQLVRFSHLNSKQEMVLELDGFVETARMASYDLQKFNSHVGRGVDNVLATARWTQRVLDDAAVKSTNRGLLPAFVQDRVLAPFQPLKVTKDTVLKQYIEHTRVISDEIDVLIAEAQALLYILQNLEDRLDVIHGIGLRDNIHAQDQKDEILSQLWTMLGGNRAALGKFNSQLNLLRQVGEYRRSAWAHVSGTIVRLQAMGAELEELRERIGSAELLADRKETPLAVHLESIRLGVERLEQARAESRELEQGHLNRVLHRGQRDNGMRLLEG